MGVPSLIQMHITAQSGPVELVNPSQSYPPSLPQCVHVACMLIKNIKSRNPARRAYHLILLTAVGPSSSTISAQSVPVVFSSPNE